MKKIVNLACVFSLIFISHTMVASAANWHINPSASGGPGCGSDWENACATLPDDLVRGDTYYLASGSYSPYVFDDAANGTEIISIVKATESEHGSNTGWQASYGQGQALFESTLETPPVTFRAPYYVFDGKIGIADGVAEAYGIKIKVYAAHFESSGLALAGLLIQQDSAEGYQGHHVTISHIEIEHGGENIHEPYCQRSVNAYIQGESGNEVEYIDISSCYLHESSGVFVLTSFADYLTFDNNYFARRGHWIAGETHCHGEAFAVHPSSHDVIISNSVFEDVEGSGIIVFGLTDGGVFDNVEIFGNVFFTNDTSLYTASAVVSTTNDPLISYWDVHHNTMADYISGGNYIFTISVPSTATDVYMYNNLFHNLGDDIVGLLFDADAVHDYNACYSAENQCENGFGTNQQLTDETHYQIFSSDPCIDSASKNYLLASATNPGNSVGTTSPYNFDRNGLQRGADGNLDRGAFEYDASLTCSEQSGTCCTGDQVCAGGSFAYSNDCGSNCCIGGGSCQTPPDDCISNGFICCDQCATGTQQTSYDDTCTSQICCSQCADANTDSNTDNDTNTDDDSNTDSNTDSDSNTDQDGNSDQDGNTDHDSNTDNDTNTDADATTDDNQQPSENDGIATISGGCDCSSTGSSINMLLLILAGLFIRRKSLIL